MKRFAFSLRAIPRFSVVVLVFSILICLPIFFMGCSTVHIDGIYPSRYRRVVSSSVFLPSPALDLIIWVGGEGVHVDGGQKVVNITSSWILLPGADLSTIQHRKEAFIPECSVPNKQGIFFHSNPVFLGGN